MTEGRACRNARGRSLRVAVCGVEAAAGSDAPDVVKLFVQVGDTITRVPRLGIIFGAYLDDRHQALLDQGMGSGRVPRHAWRPPSRHGRLSSAKLGVGKLALPIDLLLGRA